MEILYFGLEDGVGSWLGLGEAAGFFDTHAVVII